MHWSELLSIFAFFRKLKKLKTTKGTGHDIIVSECTVMFDTRKQVISVSVGVQGFRPEKIRYH